MSAAFYLLSTLGGYLLTSAVLLKYPCLLHRPKRHRFRCRHISHRGGAGENLENTMAAFRQFLGKEEASHKFVHMQGSTVRPPAQLILFIRDNKTRSSESSRPVYISIRKVKRAAHSAVNMGTDMLELDCHLTKDEQVVVSHDENLKRSTGINVNISDLKYSELPPYLCRLDVSFQKECHCEGDDQRIPLLQEVFEAFPHTPVNIDIKVNNDTLIKKVSELVTSYKREHLTVWGSVSHEVVEKCHRENDRIPILFCLRRVLLLLGLFYTGLLPFFPILEEFLEIPMPSIILKLKEPEKISRGQRFTIWLTDTLLMRKALFDHLTARGIQVYIWVLNEEQEFKRAFDLGATGVMTDYPTKLKDFLHNYPA